jgi:hypothetical protein
MKRRKFIWLSGLGVAAVSMTSIGCRSRNHVLDKTLAQPLFLSHICDAKTIRDIGTSYRQKMNGESKEDQLTDLLLTDTSGKIVPESSDTLFVQTLLERKIQKDFQTGNTVTVKGWVLSATEARQCALFSLAQ